MEDAALGNGADCQAPIGGEAELEIAAEMHIRVSPSR